MFTGIVEEIGIVTGINNTRSGLSIKVKTVKIAAAVRLGDSIAIDGVCLTVTAIKGDVLIFDVIRETLKRTTLGELKIGGSLNLERSLKADSRIAGHFVSGHVDYKGRIVDVLRGSEGSGLKVSLPRELSKLVVEKGSVALDGVSLTAADVKKGSFIVYLIPHTLKLTTLGSKKKGSFVNVETDILGKYIVKQQGPDLKTLLKKYEYI